MSQQGSDKQADGGQGKRVYGDSRPNAHKLLTETVLANARRDHAKLRPYLTCKILFNITDSRKSYLFDWTAEELKSEELSSPAEENAADCTISLSDSTLSRIASGDINPQIAMLSNKVQISGKVTFAVYVFNLIAR